MYNLNINKSSVVPTNLIVGRVLDKPFDVFQFKIFNGLEPLDLTSSTIEFRGVTPDNKKVISTDVKIIDAKSGEIEFKIPSNFYSASGKFRNAYFRITKSGQTESTNDLLINVLNAVDLNLDDSQIIIDQLDKIIEDAIAKLDKELANVKLQISQVDGNIKALKKDVEDYKATFNVQMDAMQKQLNDLANAINQTNVQRPQITAPNGGSYETWSGQYQLIDKVRQLGRGFRVVRATCDTVGQLPATGVFLLTVNVNEITGSNVNQAYLYAHTNTGHMWYTYIYANRYSGWKQVTLDGQVPKVTSNNGNQYSTLDDRNKSSVELLSSLPNGVQSVYLRTATDLPDGQILIGVKQSINANMDGQFTGVAVGGGNTYSITYSSGSSRDGWKRLDGQVAKITKDNGKSKDEWTGSFDLLEKLRTLGSGFHTVLATNTNNQLPLNDARYMMVVQIHEMSESSGYISYGRITAYSTFDGSTYVQTIRDNELKGWVRLDNVLPPIATKTQNGLLSSTDKTKLDGLKNYNNATQSTDGLMSSSDKRNLDDSVKTSTYKVNYKQGFKDYSTGSAVVINKVGRMVSIEGVYTNENVIEGGATAIIGTVPDDCKPLVDSRCICQASGGNVYHAIIMKNGDIELSRHSKGGEWARANVGSWLNIGKTYLSAN